MVFRQRTPMHLGEIRGEAGSTAIRPASRFASPAITSAASPQTKAVLP